MEKENKRLQITLSSDAIQMLEAYSSKYKISKSNLIQIVLKKYLKEEFGAIDAK